MRRLPFDSNKCKFRLWVQSGNLEFTGDENAQEFLHSLIVFWLCQQAVLCSLWNYQWERLSRRLNFQKPNSKYTLSELNIDLRVIQVFWNRGSTGPESTYSQPFLLILLPNCCIYNSFVRRKVRAPIDDPNVESLPKIESFVELAGANRDLKGDTLNPTLTIVNLKSSKHDFFHITCNDSKFELFLGDKGMLRCLSALRKRRCLLRLWSSFVPKRSWRTFYVWNSWNGNSVAWCTRLDAFEKDLD